MKFHEIERPLRDAMIDACGADSVLLSVHDGIYLEPGEYPVEAINERLDAIIEGATVSVDILS